MPSFFKKLSTLGEVTPLPNGVTLTFTIGGLPIGGYQPGTLAVFVNGNEESVEYTESDPTLSKFTFIAGCAPKTGDILTVHGFDTTPEDFVIRDEIVGIISEDSVSGTTAGDDISGAIGAEEVCGSIGNIGVSGAISNISISGKVGCP
jgi:hypothetical protein